MSKRLQIPRLTLFETLLLVLAVSILFMQPLKTASPILSYIDELLVVVCMITFVLHCIRRKKISSNEIVIVGLLLAFIVVGIIGNTISKIDRSMSAIITDVISYSKFALVSLGGVYLFKRKRAINWIFSIVVVVVRILIIMGLALGILNQFGDFGMRDDSRYGIYCFKYIYDSAAVFSWYCYMFLIVLTIDMIRGFNKRKILFICLDLVLWVFTGRSRGLAFIAIYFSLLIIFKINDMRNRQVKIRMRYFIILGILAVIVAWDQIVHYFTNTNQARNILLVVGFKLCGQYFPFGAGLGTFGTAAAQKYYSPVYNSYGISHLYGFTSDNPLYLTDTFWPAVAGEVGVIGLILFAALLFFIFRYLYRKIALNNISKFVMLFFIFTLLCSSVATSVFAQNATLGDLFYMSMIPAIIGENKTYGRETKC